MKKSLALARYLLSAFLFLSSTALWAADTDGDGFDDYSDNCPSVANPDQANAQGGLLPDAFASTAGWQTTTGFAACSGAGTNTNCMEGGALIFSYLSSSVSRSVSVSNPTSIYMSVRVWGYVNNAPDHATVTLNAYDVSNNLLDSATWSSSSIGSAAQVVNLSLSDTAVFPQVTRVEVVFAGYDGGHWGGNYGPRFGVLNLMGERAQGDACIGLIDDDLDGVQDKPTVEQISAGNNHACALVDGGVQCWGNSEYGKTTVPSLTNPVLVKAGENDTCMLDDTGLHCEGYTGNSPSALTNPTAVGIGHLHICALDNSGAHCWGTDYFGETTPPSLTNPTQIGAGYYFSCALDDTGVHCWGNSLATSVPSLTNPTMLSVGGHHACALDDNGVHCWGYNSDGQTDVPNDLTNPTAVSAGMSHTCALDDNGVHCWGNNDDGQTSVPDLTHPTAVSAGGNFTCAVDDTGLHCWGSNSDGQIAVPAAVLGDNCPHLANADQADGDGDGLGDVCDPMPSTSGLLNDKDGTVKADKMGAVVAYVGDFNQDGFGDYAVATPNYDVPAAPPVKAINNAGRVQIISGNDGSVLYALVGTPKTGFGTAVAGNADINGDGIADVAVSAPLAADGFGAKNMGKVTVIYGCKPMGCTPTTEVLYGTEAKASFGSALALGDVDHDGKADVVIGAPNMTNSGAQTLKQAGCVLLHTGANLQTESLVGCGETAKAHAGSSVAVGDFNGAGGKEVVVGAPNDDQITPTKIVDAGSVKIYTNGNPAPIYTQYGKAAKDYFGKAVAAGGDVNGDGVKDVLVGVPGLDHPTDKKLKNIGGFVVLYGNKTSAYSRGGDTLGSVAKSGFGSAVALADVNNNGFADLVIGAPKDNYTGSPKDIKGVGSVSVWAGAATEPLALLGSNSTLYGSAKGVQFGASVSAGDTNRDGKADVLMGVPGQDESVEINGKYKMQKDAGRALLMNGSSY